MASGQKIAKEVVKNRNQSPFMSMLRHKLLRVNRSSATPLPGLPTADGKPKFQDPLRYPNTQSARDQPEATIPDGVYHKLADNSYLTRDGRRLIQPPVAVYSTNVDIQQKLLDETSEQARPVNLGPSSNFGLPFPTPGFGYEWKRNNTDELPQAKNNQAFKMLDKYDKYSVDSGK